MFVILRFSHECDHVLASHPSIQMRAPLRIHISRREPYVVAVNKELTLSGHGSTIEEAIKDFVEYLISDYWVYKRSRPETLDKGAKRLLRQYERFFDGRSYSLIK